MRKIILNIMVALSLLMPTVALPATALAACGGSTPKGQALQGVGYTGKCNTNGVNNLVSTVVSILSFVAGAVAVVMIMIAGFKYMTSGGDSNRVTNAKGTLIYALIGIAIAATAQLLVHFVLNKANSIGS